MIHNYNVIYAATYVYKACELFIMLQTYTHARNLYITILNIDEYNNTIYNTIKNNYLTISYNISYVKFNLLRIITLLYTYDISLYISSLKCTTYLLTYTYPEIRATLL